VAIFCEELREFFNVLQADATFQLFCEYLLPASVFTVQNVNTAKYKFNLCYRFY